MRLGPCAVRRATCDGRSPVDVKRSGIILTVQISSKAVVAGALTWLSVPVALFIGMVGASSVFKAVYVDKRELKCACVGGSSNVPLGFVSLTENLMMIAMAIWMALSGLRIIPAAHIM